MYDDVLIKYKGHRSETDERNGILWQEKPSELPFESHPPPTSTSVRSKSSSPWPCLRQWLKFVANLPSQETTWTTWTMICPITHALPLPHPPESLFSPTLDPQHQNHIKANVKHSTKSSWALHLRQGPCRKDLNDCMTHRSSAKHQASLWHKPWASHLPRFVDSIPVTLCLGSSIRSKFWFCQSG